MALLPGLLACGTVDPGPQELLPVVQAPDPDAFARVVRPILRARCLGSGCHDSGRLSYRLAPASTPDPQLPDVIRTPRDLPPPLDSDYEETTRWLDYATPDQSELIQKATAQVKHGGGQRVAPGSAEAKAIADWIATGVAE